MTVKELQETVKNKSIRVFNQNAGDKELKLEDVLDEEVVGIFIEEDIIVKVNIEEIEKITLTEFLKEVGKMGDKSLWEGLEGMLDCDYCPLEKKCNIDTNSGTCVDTLEKYIKLE